MNQAEVLLRQVFGCEAEPGDSIGRARDVGAMLHPQAHHSLFGPSGVKEQLVGREAFLAFVGRCSAALAGRSDEILDIIGIDEQCAFVRARAWRKSAASGEEITYEWAMLYRVENGLVTYAADMLDADAQAFWGRVLSTSPQPAPES